MFETDGIGQTPSSLERYLVRIIFSFTFFMPMNLMEAENLFLPLDSEMKRVFDHFAIFIFY